MAANENMQNIHFLKYAQIMHSHILFLVSWFLFPFTGVVEQRQKIKYLILVSGGMEGRNANYYDTAKGSFLYHFTVLVMQVGFKSLTIFACFGAWDCVSK